MHESRDSWREKLRELIFGSELSGEGLRRLLVLLLSVAAVKAVFRFGLLLVAVAGLAVWFGGRGGEQTVTVDPETVRKAAEARAMAQDARQIVDEAHEKAQATRNEFLARKLASEVQSAVQNTAVAMLAYVTDKGGPYTDDYAELENYGWQANPDLIYDPIRLVKTIDGKINFIITIRHRQEDVPAYTFDYMGGRGVELAGSQTVPAWAASDQDASVDPRRN